LGKGNDSYFASAVIADAFGISLKQIVGYEGASESKIAAVRGVVDGVKATVGALFPLFKARELYPILLVGLERDSQLLGVTTAIEAVPKENKDIIVALVNVFALGKAIVGPPEIPEGRKKVLGEALWKVFQDENFIDELEKRGRIVIPLKVEEVEQLIEDCISAAGILKPILKKVME